MSLWPHFSWLIASYNWFTLLIYIHSHTPYWLLKQSKLRLFGASLLGRRCRDWTSRNFNWMPLLYIISECDSAEIICARQTTTRQKNSLSSEWIEWHFCPVCLYQRYLDLDSRLRLGNTGGVVHSRPLLHSQVFEGHRPCGRETGASNRGRDMATQWAW